MSGHSLLFVVDGRRGHATRRARGGVFREAFEREGWTVGFADAAVDQPADIVAAARRHEIVCLLKVGSLSLVRSLLRDRHNKRDGRARVVFDLTDPLWKRVHRRAGWHDLERILRVVDAVICENAITREYALRFNPNVAIVPASAQVERFDAARETQPPHDSRRVVIGWVGSRGTAGALARVRAPLERVCARHPEVVVRAVGCRIEDAERALSGLPFSVLPEYDEAGMVREMLSLDIGLFPMPTDLEDYRVRGALKALLYMGAGVPAVSQAGGDCSEVVEDGVTGMLADGDAEWEAKIEALVVSPDLRRRMGAAALDFARRERSIVRVLLAYREALLGALALPPARRAAPLSVRSKEAVAGLCHRVDAWAHRARRLLS